MNDETLNEVRQQIKDLEWSVEYHRKKLKGAELMLEVHKDILNNQKKA